MKNQIQMPESVLETKDNPFAGLDAMAKEISNCAEEHGWWEKEREIPEIIALIHSEISEAFESARKGEALYWEKPPETPGALPKPEGAATELVDAIIRILDWMGHYNIPVEDIIRRKHEYNKHRAYRNGNKKY